MRIQVLAVALAVGGANAAQAEILDAAANGFNVRHVIEVPDVTPPVAWAALADIAKWWDPEHTYSGDARNLRLEPIVQGCFCESLSLYAGIEHARVVYAQPARTLRLSGAFGPLQALGVAGSLTWQIDAAGDGSRITLTYNVGGFAERPLSEWASAVDEVLGEQLARLGRYLESGDPNAPPRREER
jgi:hypothetical protein